MKDNPVVQFVVLVLTVKAGLLLLQFGASYLPTTGIAGAFKTVLAK